MAGLGRSQHFGRCSLVLSWNQTLLAPHLRLYRRHPLLSEVDCDTVRGGGVGQVDTVCVAGY